MAQQQSLDGEEVEEEEQEPQQRSLEGDIVGAQAEVQVRSRPSTKFTSGPFIIKSNARTIAKARGKGYAKLREKMRVRKEYTDNIGGFTDEELDKHRTAVLEAAMHGPLPDYDENWSTKQHAEVEKKGEE